MSKKSLRTPFVALSIGLFLIFAFRPVPSVPSIPSDHLSDEGLEEVFALEDLAAWLLAKDGTELEALSPHDLRAEIKEKPRTFELFRSYTEPQSQRDRLLDLPFGQSIQQVADRHDLDALLVAAVVEVESSFSPEVVSPQGAVGLMQVLPSTGKLVGVENLTNPQANLDAGARYLSQMLERFEGELDLALAAYNAGPGNVSRYGGIPPFRETQAYVGKVLSVYVDHHKSVWDASGSTDLLALR